MIIYLRFANESEAKTVMSQYVKGGQWQLSSSIHSLDPIGSMIITPAVLSSIGDVITSEVIDNRFHVNFQGDDSAAFASYKITPTNPRRTWS